MFVLFFNQQTNIMFIEPERDFDQSERSSVRQANRNAEDSAEAGSRDLQSRDGCGRSAICERQARQGEEK